MRESLALWMVNCCPCTLGEMEAPLKEAVPVGWKMIAPMPRPVSQKLQ